MVDNTMTKKADNGRHYTTQKLKIEQLTIGAELGCPIVYITYFAGCIAIIYTRR